VISKYATGQGVPAFIFANSMVAVFNQTTNRMRLIKIELISLKPIAVFSAAWIEF
jgi:hypothetical protein